MMKRIAFLLGFLFTFSFAGCTVMEYTEDNLEKYNEFLSYSLGNFMLVEERARRGNRVGFPGAPIIATTEWDLLFERLNGERRVFSFDNRLSMENFVLDLASEIAQDDLVNDFISNYFPMEEFAGDSHARVIVRPPLHSDRSPYILDLQNGLRLSSVTPQELITDWGFTLHTVNIFTSDYRNYGADATEQFTTLLGSLSQFLEQDQIRFTFVFNLNDLSSITIRGIYNAPISSFELEQIRGNIQNDFENYMYVRERFKKIVRTLAVYLEQDQIGLRLSMMGGIGFEESGLPFDYFSDLSFSGIYDRWSDTFEIQTNTELRGEREIQEEAHEEEDVEAVLPTE